MILSPVILLVFSVHLAQDARADALEDYVTKPDPSFHWKPVEQRTSGSFTVTHLELVSQQWRGRQWEHHVQVVQPARIRNPDFAFLLITGDGDGTRSIGMLKTISERAGVLAAVVTRVPNQPLYDGRKEDALIAYTFDQYLKTGDETWPLLFPMVKSAVRAMDAVTAFGQQDRRQKIERFVLSGASKRGWTTWLTGAVDARVKGIAPMVFDMLNMKAQTQWAEKVYGRQSERIRAYTDLGLTTRMDEPGMVKLRSWVDPYSYRQRYNMPKLILLGTNDPYWTVDALRHYWSDLPGPKLLYQTPNAGHDLGGGEQATQTLAAFVQMVADRQPLPKMDWQFQDTARAQVSVELDQPIHNIRLWTAFSTDRDFRDDKWTATELDLQTGGRRATATVATPSNGYRAFLAEAVLTSTTGQQFRLSTEARVTPDNIR